jgi:tetratricopeptide (TPR) repeat protein
MPLRPFLLPVVLLAIASRCAAGDDLAAARDLFQARKYPEARAILTRIVATDPRNAQACHYLGLACKTPRSLPAYEEALKWLAQAVAIAPNDAGCLADFGGTSMEFAGMIRAASLTRAMGYATRGRDAMEKSLTIDPENLNAREGLFRFYTQAPWPIGSSSKAAAQLAEIRKRNPDRALRLGVQTAFGAKDYAKAFTLCEDAMARNPESYPALCFFGQAAAISGLRLEHGLACLQRACSLASQPQDSFSKSSAWFYLGNIQERLRRVAEARSAYETALGIDPNNKFAAGALARISPASGK